jgi:hypothetical protein
MTQAITVISTAGAGQAERLRVARGVLDGAAARSVGDRGQTRRTEDPTPSGGVLPVTPGLAEFLPGGGLRRGSTIRVRSSTSLLLALLAEASADGTWCAIVGMPELGLVAAHEAGLDLARVALVPNPGGELVAVTSALLDGLDLVAIAGTARLRAGDRQRLAARTRHRGAVLLPVDAWPGADLEIGLAGTLGGWRGIGAGHGRLRARKVQVRLTGRGSAQRGAKTSLLLPGPTGAPTQIEWSTRAPVQATPPVAVADRTRRAG